MHIIIVIVVGCCRAHSFNSFDLIQMGGLSVCVYVFLISFDSFRFFLRDSDARYTNVVHSNRYF